MRDWDDAFDNMGHVAGSASLPAMFAARAAAWRAAHPQRVEEAIPYGEGPRQLLDLVHPETEPAGLVVFVHGGYWMRLDRTDWTDLAAGAVAAGWAVALPSYTLTPAARICEISREIAAAIAVAARRIAGPIRLVGHSAGGHLVSRMCTVDGLLPEEIARRVARTVSISGLHDLRPLLHTRMNDTLRLTMEEARAESPALLEPIPGTSHVAWVGGSERPEFIRQSRLIAMLWDGLGASTALVVEPGHNHFTIIDGLQQPDSPLTAMLLGG